MTIKDLIRPIMCRILSIRRFRAVLPPPPKVPASPSHTAYPSFEAAMAECGIGAYNDVELADVMFKKTRALAAKRVRDAVHEANAIATLEALQLARTTQTRVLDFGGNCGLHYFLAKQETGQAFKWAVVEIPLIVKASVPLRNSDSSATSIPPSSGSMVSPRSFTRPARSSIRQCQKSYYRSSLKSRRLALQSCEGRLRLVPGG
jgi:hypothetical protein